MRKICTSCSKSADGLLGSICSECYNYNERIKVQCKKAKQKGVADDLTLAQWIATVQYFKGRCAYCGRDAFLFIEHFIPVGLGGGTTASNCVPACNKCNTRKGELHPDDVKLITSKAIERVREYLARLENLC